MNFVHIFTSIHIPAGVKYDSVLAERGVASQGAQSHNEYVVYDPAQVLPQSHIIYVYTNTHTHTQFLSHMHVDISYTISHCIQSRVVYDAAQVLGGRGAQGRRHRERRERGRQSGRGEERESSWE
jgi:hypothetical protein